MSDDHVTTVPGAVPRLGAAGDATALFVAEYQSVREEWLQARNAQNQTLQWTFGGMALVLAAIVGAKVRAEQPFLYVILSTIILAVAVSSQAVWFGELLRMERAALFLRGRERQLMNCGVEIYGMSPLLWESFRAHPPQGRQLPWVPKSVTQIVAGFAVYGGASATSIVMLLDSAFLLGRYTGLAVSLALGGGALYLSVTMYIGTMSLKILRVSERSAELGAIVKPGPG